LKAGGSRKGSIGPANSLGGSLRSKRKFHPASSLRKRVTRNCSGSGGAPNPGMGGDIELGAMNLPTEKHSEKFDKNSADKRHTLRNGKSSDTNKMESAKSEPDVRLRKSAIPLVVVISPEKNKTNASETEPNNVGENLPQNSSGFGEASRVRKSSRFVVMAASDKSPEGATRPTLNETQDLNSILTPTSKCDVNSNQKQCVQLFDPLHSSAKS